MQGFNSDYICIKDPRFPPSLALTPDCPVGVYFKGNLDLGKLQKSLAIVGTRRCSRYCTEVLKLFMPELTLNKVTIVSGFMYGVDYEAHSICLDFDGYTVAVLPFGIDFCPTSYMTSLYNRILTHGGLIISEYPEKHPPEKWTFIARNRIVAGLSAGVVIVEAALKSGSIITARKTLEYGGKVCAIPGSITADTSKGTNELIKMGLDGNAVIPVNQVSDIFDTFSFKWGLKEERLSDEIVFRHKNLSGLITNKGPNDLHVSQVERNLLQSIKLNSGLTFEEILEQHFNDNNSELSLIYYLTKLQIQGFIEEGGGRYYAC
ncbi:DNA-protecting protein DprA [candidate division WWE3 bacterium]|nr:DNA-protecting protein DprA [candidate division WWE3 bacterium]